MSTAIEEQCSRSHGHESEVQQAITRLSSTLQEVIVELESAKRALRGTPYGAESETDAADGQAEKGAGSSW